MTAVPAHRPPARRRLARAACVLAAGAALAAAGPAAAVDPVLVPELQVRLGTPGIVPGLAAPVEAQADDPGLVADVVLTPGDPRRAEVAAALLAAGFRGAVIRDQAGPDPAAAQVRVRTAVAALASAAVAQARVQSLLGVVRTAPGQVVGAVGELANVPGGRVVGLSDPATGQTRAVVVFASGPYLVVSEMDALPPFAAAPGPLIALAEEVAGAAPGTPDAGAAQGLGVPTSLRAAIRSAFRRARPQDPATRTGPLPGTVSAALLDGRIWAVADMGSPTAGDPQLFRGTADGGLQAVGRVRVAAGCPVLPRSLRLTWGLDEACPAGTPDPVLPGEGAVAGELPEAVRGVGHWVWELERSAPSPEALADRAVRAGIRTLYVKSGDGARYWSQFDRAVGPLKARGLRVCGWQYVYGRAPEAEARVAARAVRAGADCFVVDAEIEFERGRLYGPARRYMRALRAEVGRDYPVGLTSFAYVDLHRSFPYSAFLAAPDGAQFTMPQVYWKAFRVPVAVAMERTYRWNRIYGVPIAPIGGTYLGESAADILRFRCAAELLGSASVSYWSWQHTRGGQWGALASPVRCAAERQGPPASRYPELGRGSTGDPVVWLQTRLRAWGERVPVDGRLGSGTLAAVQRVRARAGLGGVTTRLDDPTWELLLTAPGTAPAAPAGVARRG